MLKQITVLTIAVLAMLGSLAPGQAATKLLWQTPATGVTISPSSLGKPIQLGQPIDASAYDRIRVVVVARRPAGLGVAFVDGWAESHDPG